MAKRRVKDKLEIKCEKLLSKLWKEFNLDFKNMINWLLFYKPKDKFDKYGHILEVICAYVILQFAWVGIVGR